MILVNVLLIVALASGVVVLMLTAQDDGLQRALRLREAARADAIVRGGELSAIVALRRDALIAPDSDTPREPWARIGDSAAKIDGGTFSLAIADAQARFNINLLARRDAASVQLFVQIVGALGLPADVATRAAALVQGLGGISDLSQLALAGIDRRSIDRLATLVTALPGTTPINVNTADARLLGVLLGDPAAGRFLAARRDGKGSLTPDDFALAQRLLPPGAGYTSDFYWVRARVAIGDTVREQASLLHRRRQPAGPTVVSIGRWNGLAVPAQAPALADRPIRPIPNDSPTS